jgi:hypothetical protein
MSSSFSFSFGSYFLGPEWFGVGGWWLDMHNLRNDIHVTAMWVNISSFYPGYLRFITSQDVFIGLGLWCFLFIRFSRGLGIFVSFSFLYSIFILHAYYHLIYGDS